MKPKQHVVVFGAAGRVGSLVTVYALGNGHKVTAFVHRRHNLPRHPNLTIVQGDVYNLADVVKALRGANVVVSTLSSWGTKRKDVLSNAMANIIPVMKKRKISRIISLTGAEARASGDKLGIIHRFAHMGIGIVGGKVLHDGERHIMLLEQSGLNWTVLRSPIMRPGSQRYCLSSVRPRPWASVGRQAVARAIVDQIENEHDPGAIYIR